MQKKKQKEMIRRDVPVVEPDIELGLRAEQVKERAVNGWSNGMPQSASKTEKEIVLEKCLTFFNLVFVILALVLVIGGSSVKNMTFLVVMICNTVIGIFQEIRAKRAVDKLTLVAVQQVRTIRDGKLQKIRSSKLVRDDIVEFVSGDQICADGVLRAGYLQVNESLVTGEEDAIVKLPGDELKSGSFVVAGTGRAQLTRVGADSFAAKLALEAKANPQAAKSEMMRSLDKLIRVVGFGLIPIGVILFYQSFAVLGQPLRESTEGTVAALIGMIPEGLYLLTSVAMAVSALKLTKKKVLVQDMNCIETLARVDVLCVDKTGTITEAVMEVDNVVPLTEDDPERLEQILAAIYTGVEPENDTARAMAEMFAGETDWQCVGRIPFTSRTKWSAASFKDQGAYIVGAPEFIMGSRYDELREYVNSWSSFGYRVLLVAEYTGEPSVNGLIPERLRPLALVLVSNRVRPEAEETFRYFAQQGVCIKVISGDNPVTVSEVARRAGIENAELYVDAGTLESDKDFLQAVEQYTVFGRVTPDKKKKLIIALQEKGHTVAMTGDGVNDVLAMKQADCGIAMASGSQAASQVAQIVLLKSDFSAMPGIVAEGRRVINNIQRAATLFLVKNIFSLGLAIINLFAGLPYPMVPLHLSVISALTIGVPSFFLAMEPNYERVEGRFLPTVMRKALPGGLTNIFVVLMAQAFMVIFGLALEQVSSVCAAILSVVGLLVLYQTCKPFGKIRKIIWWAMAAGLLVCFTFFRSFFELHLEDNASSLVMVVLLIMTPTVFFAVQRVFDWGDMLIAFVKRKLKRK
ncbi:MAG: cation-translocating P-type ATPase [Oscillospiraceae bacterium]|nr:cation-translocating P-type ATPase [Oscillospiraceae bacterium]MBQ9929781.1 cation-translocating P-type ATPase [Oscillospiraceae bacterium]